MASKPLTLLEQWLEGVPNSNHREADVKREKKEFIPSCSSSTVFDPSSYLDRTSFPVPTVPANPPAPPPVSFKPLILYTRSHVVIAGGTRSEGQVGEAGHRHEE